MTVALATLAVSCWWGASATLTGWLAVIAWGQTCTWMEGVATPTPRPVTTVEMSDFLADWEKNPISTVDRYKGSYVETTGYLSLIKMGTQQQMYALITVKKGGSHGDPHIMAFFLSPALLEQLKKHEIGSRVTVVLTEFEADSTPRARAKSIRAAD